MQKLLPQSDFRLFSVCVRFPQNLAQTVTLTRVQAGAYDVQHFSGTLRVIVVHELPLTKNNALLHLFSAQGEQVRYGATHYQIRSQETSTLILQLFQRYQQEDTDMTDALREFADKKIAEILANLPVEKRLEGVPVDDLLAALPPETRAALIERVRGLSTPEAQEPEQGEGKS